MGAAICLAISASSFIFFNLGISGVGYGVATGGTSSSITVGGQSYTLLTFTSDDNLVVSTAGLFDVLMFGGGGAGGRSNAVNQVAGGGGAGGVLQTTVYLDATTYAVDVGAGGASNLNGLGSSVGTTNRSLSVAGGGAGIYQDNIGTHGQAADGACGGGGCFFSGVGHNGGDSFNSGVSGFDGGNNTGASIAGAGGGGATTTNRANRRAVMTSKKISKAKRQIGDQTTKGGLIGLMIYGLNAQGVDPMLISMLVPVASSVLAWASTKVGDPDLACLFIPHDDEDKPKS
jgi:hypothetical protein